MLAFPSYNYEGYFKLEQVIELKSAYIFSHITITIPAPKFPPFSTTSAPLPPNDNDH